MGGILVNGCGVADHLKKLKCLGTFYCPICKKDREFYVSEAKQKIDVLFIPTITLKTRYAVTCAKCKNGEFCSDQWVRHLLNSSTPPTVIYESQARQENVSLESSQVQESRAVGFCPSCGSKVTGEMAFCAECGTKL